MQHFDLAWSLAEAAEHVLDDSQRCAVYVALGAGDYSEAITDLAQVAANNQIALPKAVAEALTAWQNAYGGRAEIAPSTPPLAHPHPPVAQSGLARDHRAAVLNIAASYRRGRQV